MDNVITNRSRLGFQEAVRKHFAFLEEQHGYRCDSVDLYCVKYSSAKVYLNIYHEKLSYEIYLVIGLLPENYNSQLKVTSRDIIKMFELNENPYYQASNFDDVNTAIEKLSNIVSIYAKDALEGVDDYFKAIAAMRVQSQKDVLHAHELKIAEEKAKKAWDRKDFEAIVEIYDKIEKQLTPAQLKMLDYARRNIPVN